MAAREGRVIESYAPCGRPATNKAQMAHAAANRLRSRTYDVEAAYLKGKMLSNEIVFARPPPGFRHTDSRGVAIVWRLKVPLYGEVDAGFIWNRTLVDQLVNKQGFTQSEFDPCFFFKLLADGTRMNIVMYVDDGFVTDEHSELADAELAAFNAAGFTIEIKELKRFLGANTTLHSDSRITVAATAYVTQLATRFLPKPLAEYPLFQTPCTRDLVNAYERAVARSEVLSAEDQ